MERLRRALREFVYAWRGDDTEADLWRDAYASARNAWLSARADADAANARARVAVDEAIRMGIYWRDQYGAMGRYADALRGERDAAWDVAAAPRKGIAKRAKKKATKAKRGNRKR